MLIHDLVQPQRPTAEPFYCLVLIPSVMLSKFIDQYNSGVNLMNGQSYCVQGYTDAVEFEYD